MQITIFSVWMTFVWCSIFIVLCYILRKRSVLLNLSSMTGIIILYLFCLIRLAVPVELPWTKVVSGGSLYNFLYQIFGCEITCVAGHEIYVYHIFVVAWGVVMAVLLTRYLIQYHRVVSYFSEMEKTEDTELNNILDEICTDKEKRNIKIVQTAAVEVPCCIGIFEKRILIPDKKYSREELHYIILHEYTHLDNKDILTIQLINILCIVFWWNPFVYILKGDMYQSIYHSIDRRDHALARHGTLGDRLRVADKINAGAVGAYDAVHDIAAVGTCEKCNVAAVQPSFTMQRRDDNGVAPVSQKRRHAVAAHEQRHPRTVGKHAEHAGHKFVGIDYADRRCFESAARTVSAGCSVSRDLNCHRQIQAPSAVRRCVSAHRQYT